MTNSNKKDREIIGVIGNAEHNQLINYDTNKYYDDSSTINLDLENNAHSLICRNVKKNSTVLDVGCAQGIIGKILHRQLDCTVYGVEIDEEAKKLAEQSGDYDGVFLLDITNPNGKEYERFKKLNKKFDYIIFADVLEHLVRPEEVLVAYSKLLTEHGKILISVPNIAHYDIINGLLNGNFNYAKMGILDNTHLRFFTKNSFMEFIDSINEHFGCNFVCKCFASTFFKPDFWGEYKMLDEIIAENPDCCALQHLFELSVAKNAPKNGSIQKVNLTKDIEDELSRVKRDNRSLENHNRVLSIQNGKLRRAHHKFIESHSWRLTKPLRYIARPVKKISGKIDEAKNYLEYYERRNKPAIMFFVHTWINLDNINFTDVGGTTLNTLDIIEGIKDKYDCYVITTINDEYVLVEIDECGNQKIYALDIPIFSGDYDEYNSVFYARIKNLIEELQINILHIQHIWNFPCDLGLLASMRKTILTIHDYTFFRPKEQAFTMTCKKCPTISDARKEATELLLHNTDLVVVPSNSIKEEFLNQYPALNHKTRIVENGIHNDKMPIKRLYERDKVQKEFNIAFVGVIDGHKGYDNILSLIKLTDDSRIKYHLFGVTANAKINDCPNFVNHGRYQREDLPELLNKNRIDLVCFLGDCRESFSYTLSEVFYARVPVLSFDLGAIGERIKASGAGWTVKHTKNMEIILNCILKLINSDEYREKQLVVKNVRIQTVADMTSSLMKNYDCNRAEKDPLRICRCLNSLELLRIIKNDE